jgi:hypothetical protein
MDWLKAIGYFLVLLILVGVVIGICLLFAAIGATVGFVLLGILVVWAVVAGVWEACKPNRRR